MKRLVLFMATLVLLACSMAQAANITDAIKIERASAPNTFTVSFLYNTYLGVEDYPFQWEVFDIMIAAEPIGINDPITERGFTPGEILVGSGNGYLYLGGYDWTSFTAPYQAVQITASCWVNSGNTQIYQQFPTNTPLFSFTYEGSASEFVIYDSMISQEVEAGRIPIPSVPEPATILGLGLPMLMLGASKLKGLRK